MVFGKNFVALFAALLLLSGAVSAAISLSSYTVNPAQVKPGEQGSIAFSISNVLPSSATTTVSPLEGVQVFFAAAPGIEFTAQSPYMVGTIASGGSSVVTVPFKVLPTAKAGVATVSFYVREKDQTDLKTMTAAIQVVNPPIITLSSDRQTIQGTDAINLTIRNDGGAAGRATLRIAEGSNFSFVGMTQIYIGDLSGTGAVVVPIDARNVVEGVTTIPFLLSYQQEGGITTNETKYLTMGVKKEKADVAFTQAEPIVTSQTGALSMKVRNNGKELKDFKIYLEDSYVKPTESKEVKLGDFFQGATREFSIPVFASAEPGVRTVSLRLRWVEGGVDKEEAVAVPIVVNSDAEAAIFLDAKPSPIVAGGDHTLSILVSNVGSYKIQNVEVTLQDSPAYEIFNAQRSQYIGGLESDDFSTVQYRVRMREVAPGNYPVEMSVRYKDQSGVWVSRNQSIDVYVRSKADAAPKNGGDATLPILVALAAAAGGGYWYFKLRKPKDGAKK